MTFAWLKTLHTIRSPFPAPETKAKACGTQSEVDGRAAQCAPRLHNLEGQNCVAWTGRGNHDPGIAKCSMSWQTNGITFPGFVWSLVDFLIWTRTLVPRCNQFIINSMDKVIAR